MAAPVRTPASTWVAEGLRALAAGGPEAVRVETLAEALGVSKGGFYHQFEDRSALLKAVLEAWEQMVIDDAIQRVEAEGGDARDKLRRLGSLASPDADFVKIELAIRDWARRDTAVSKRLRRIDKRRLDYLRSLLSELCRDETEVEIRSLLIMTLFIGAPLLATDHSSRQFSELFKQTQERLFAD